MNQIYLEVNFVRNNISDMIIGDFVLPLEKQSKFNPRQKDHEIGIYISSMEKK